MTDIITPEVNEALEWAKGNIVCDRMRGNFYAVDLAHAVSDLAERLDNAEKNGYRTGVLMATGWLSDAGHMRIAEYVFSKLAEYDRGSNQEVP